MEEEKGVWEEVISVQYALEVTGARGRGSFWARAWFLISALPRYLFTGAVRLP